MCLLSFFSCALPFPSLSDNFFLLFFSFFFLEDVSYFCPPIHFLLCLYSSYVLPLAPVLFLTCECYFSRSLPILFTHTGRRDTAWVQQGRTELVPNWQGIAYFMCVIENANAQEQWLLSQFFCWRIYEEHQTPLWSFRSRPFSTAITWVDKGIPKANHSPSSLLWIWLFSRRWKFNRNAIYLQAFQQWRFQQLHAESSTPCTLTAYLRCPFSSFASLKKHFVKWEEKKYGHERIWLPWFSKSMKNILPSSSAEIGSSALEFMVLVQGWDGRQCFNYSNYWSKGNIRNIKKKDLIPFSQTVGHTWLFSISQGLASLCVLSSFFLHD